MHFYLVQLLLGFVGSACYIHLHTFAAYFRFRSHHKNGRNKLPGIIEKLMIHLSLKSIEQKGFKKVSIQFSI